MDIDTQKKTFLKIDDFDGEKQISEMEIKKNKSEEKDNINENANQKNNKHYVR